MAFITLAQYAMGRDKAFPAEWEEAKANAVELLVRVNSFLETIGWTGELTVSSGWRPLAYNRKITTAAKNSFHIRGKAIDIADPTGKLAEFINPLFNEKHQDALRLYKLFMERPGYTPGWVHLDYGLREDRKSRTFIP